MGSGRPISATAGAPLAERASQLLKRIELHIGVGRGGRRIRKRLRKFFHPVLEAVIGGWVWRVNGGVAEVNGVTDPDVVRSFCNNVLAAVVFHRRPHAPSILTPEVP